MCKRFNVFSWLLAAFFALWFAPQAATAHENPDREFVRTINREFSTLANGMTAIYNKYGKVNINTWNNNSVKIDITIVVNASDQRMADKAFDRIKINFTNTPGYVKAETFITDGNNENSWWPVNNTCDDYKINYEVWMPVGNQLDLKNKYGNSFVGNLNNKLMADVRYGDLRTESLGGDADLYVGYGKAFILRANNISGQVSYGQLNVTTARDVQLDTKYSELQIDNAYTVRIISKYDDFKFGHLDDLRLQTKYADVKVQQARSTLITAQYTDVKVINLIEKMDIDLAYGNLQVDAIGRGFQGASIVGKHANVKLVTERGTHFRFDAEGEYTDMVYPVGATLRHREATARKSVAAGFVGDANAQPVVKLRGTYGKMVIK